jgi:class 3 adenylate cyclase/tetratricopeptide (TPR) repeat protein
VTCRTCGAALPPAARFCAACGTSVEARCSACGEAIPDGARFCPSCGTAVETATAQPAEAAGVPAAFGRERKVATLLFADLVGSTALGEAHDPEVVGALVAEVFGRLAEEVERYEGTVEKFAGDAMLAVFGVPTIHEDDPERAVRAALEMQAAIVELAADMRARSRPEPQLRIGIESGEVLVDLARASAERDLFVTGDAVNTAARLQQAAAPGSVVVGPAVYAATRHLVDYEELDSATLRGKAAPVAAWRAVAVKARRSGQRAPLGIEAAVVGRDEEVALLKETVRRTVADGRPHLVTVVGAAGVGKSRLAWELEKYLDGLPDVYHWRKGRCLAYAQASYSALADVVKADARIMDDDAPATAMGKLDERIAEVHGADADPGIAAALRAVLALGPLGTVAREDLFEAWRRHLDAVARLAPLVLVLEDIHWADEGLLDVIEFLARWGEAPVLILCLARHELLERRPAWGGGTLNASTIVLEPLEPAETSRLVDGLLGGALPPTLRDRIVELADGNPLFSEELVRMFVDRGVLRFADGRWELAQAVEDVAVPGSVQAVLAARLDGLPAAEKRLAQNAAVVGRIFWDAVLAHLSRQGPAATADLIRRLRVKELVVPREPSSLAGAAEFGFRHVLIRDVAYDSLPKRDRAALHLAVARWAQDALSERREEFVELLAAHHLSALRYEEEFSVDGDGLRRLREETLDAVLGAARRAFRLGQAASATDWMRAAIDLARKLELDARRYANLVEEFREVAFGNVSGESVYPIVREAVERMRALPDPSPDDRVQTARLEAIAAASLYLAQRPDDARALLDESLSADPPPAGRAALLNSLGWLEWRLGRAEPAIAPLEESIALAEQVGDERLRRTSIHDLGIALSWHDGQRGMVLLEQSFELAKAAGDVNLLSRCYINLGSIRMGNGDDWREIEPFLEEGLDRARRRVDPMAIAWIAANLAELQWNRGRPRHALELYREAVDAAARVGDRELEGTRRVGIAAAHVLLGDRDGALALLDDETRRVTETEAQTKAYLATVDLWLAWPEVEPEIDRILERVATSDVFPNADIVGLPLASAAMRLGRDDAVARGAKLVLDALGVSTGPRTRLLCDWARALAESSAADRGADLERIGDELERLGYLLPAADALADAAVLLARSGRDGGPAAARARALYARCEVVPPFGDPVDAVAAVAGRPA